jgi:tetrahydromethanopterin S-methyltransferase subunit G
MTDKEIKKEFERLHNVANVLATGTGMSKKQLEVQINDAITRLTQDGDRRFERTIEQLRVASQVLRTEGLRNTERLTVVLNTASAGLAQLINARFDHVDNRLDDIDQHIDDNTDDVIDAVAGNPVITTVVAILATIVGIVTTMISKAAFGKLTDVLYREDGSAVMKNGKIVEVAQYSNGECLFYGILTGIVAAGLILLAYFIVSHIISARRARG